MPNFFNSKGDTEEAVTPHGDNSNAALFDLADYMEEVEKRITLEKRITELCHRWLEVRADSK